MDCAKHPVSENISAVGIRKTKQNFMQRTWNCTVDVKLKLSLVAEAMTFRRLSTAVKNLICGALCMI